MGAFGKGGKDLCMSPLGKERGIPPIAKEDLKREVEVLNHELSRFSRPHL